MTETKPPRWRPPHANQAALMAAAKQVSDDLIAYAAAARARLAADAIEAEFSEPDKATTSPA